MPTVYRGGGGRLSSERTYHAAMDWVRRLMQLSALATILLYAYLLWGLFGGDVSQWATITGAARLRIFANVQGAVHYLNLSLGVLLLTACILFYDEEAFGYTLLAGAIAFFYGIPFLFDMFMAGQVQAWSHSNNKAALAIYQQFHVAAIMLAAPGVILVLRDLVLRFVGGAARRRDDFASMQYGAQVREEAPPSSPIIGMFARCWQLPFCRDAIRKRCPIFLNRTRCWRQRTGCMCEENVIRHAMDAIINKETISFDSPAKPADTLIEGLDSPSAPRVEPTVEVAEPPVPVGRKVAIPHNPNLPMSVKVERCRNCVIYNEHQRKKYQFFAPLFVIAVPALAFWKLPEISTFLRQLLGQVDQLMSKISLTSTAKSPGIEQTMNTSGQMAEYLVIGCIVIIATSAALRFLEYLVFKLKI